MNIQQKASLAVRVAKVISKSSDLSAIKTLAKSFMQLSDEKIEELSAQYPDSDSVVQEVPGTKLDGSSWLKQGFSVDGDGVPLDSDKPYIIDPEGVLWLDPVLAVASKVLESEIAPDSPDFSPVDIDTSYIDQQYVNGEIDFSEYENELANITGDREFARRKAESSKISSTSDSASSSVSIGDKVRMLDLDKEIVTVTAISGPAGSEVYTVKYSDGYEADFDSSEFQKVQSTSSVSPQAVDLIGSIKHDYFEALEDGPVTIARLIQIGFSEDEAKIILYKWNTQVKQKASAISSLSAHVSSLSSIIEDYSNIDSAYSAARMNARPGQGVDYQQLLDSLNLSGSDAALDFAMDNGIESYIATHSSAKLSAQSASLKEKWPQIKDFLSRLRDKGLRARNAVIDNLKKAFSWMTDDLAGEAYYQFFFQSSGLARIRSRSDILAKITSNTGEVLDGKWSPYSKDSEFGTFFVTDGRELKDISIAELDVGDDLSDDHADDFPAFESSKMGSLVSTPSGLARIRSRSDNFYQCSFLSSKKSQLLHCSSIKAVSHGSPGTCLGSYPLSKGITKDSEGEDIDPKEMYFEGSDGTFSFVGVRVASAASSPAVVSISADGEEPLPPPPDTPAVDSTSDGVPVESSPEGDIALEDSGSISAPEEVEPDSAPSIDAPAQEVLDAQQAFIDFLKEHALEPSVPTEAEIRDALLDVERRFGSEAVASAFIGYQFSDEELAEERREQDATEALTDIKDEVDEALSDLAGTVPGE